jgi:phosphoglucosamine mutase
MARQLFGTDGIRGVAGEFPLDPATTFSVGAALGRLLASQGANPEVVLGIDTRESGPWLASYVAGGLAQSGARARFAGVITTPGIAYLTRTNHFVAGVMISASHNPFQDNGIKIFDHSGYKLPDAAEEALEQQILSEAGRRVEPVAQTLTEEARLDEEYLAYLTSTFPHRLEGWRIALDCANGAAYRLAPALIQRTGAAVVDTIGCSPDGRNINLNCGALHLDALRQAVLASGADVGAAFDGDADRAILVSSSGRIVDGDGILLIAARYLARRGRLPGPGGKPAVVATVMSNLGLERALEREGIAMLRAPVGDRYVLEEMLRHGIALGGEQSGHVIFHEYATTGDGLLTVLRILQALMEDGLSLDEAVEGLVRFPQRLENIRVRTRAPFEELPEVQTALREAHQELHGKGRILLRYSGTELLARVMVEAEEQELVDRHTERVAQAVRQAIGV